MLPEQAHGGADADIAEISGAEADQIVAGLAAPVLAACGGPAALGGPRLSATTRHGAPGAMREAPARETEGCVSGFYWKRHPGGPFATPVAVAPTYCSAETCDGLRPADR